MTSEKVWVVAGTVKQDGEKEGGGRHKQDARQILLCAPDFDEAVKLAPEALLHNWSRHPHTATVLSIAPAAWAAAGGEQMEVHIP